MKKYCNSERTLLYSDRTKRNFAVNVPEINTKTKEKNEANRQYEEHLNNYHASFENSPICLFKLGKKIEDSFSKDKDFLPYLSWGKN